MRATYLVIPDVQSAILASGTLLGRGVILAPVGRSPGARILAHRVAGAYIKHGTTGKYHPLNLHSTGGQKLDVFGVQCVLFTNKDSHDDHQELHFGQLLAGNQ